jgi:glycogen debranching enzyme
LAQRAKRTQKSFVEAFRNEERPEQIFALSLPFPVLPKPKAARWLAEIEDKVRERAELLGPYLSALVRVHGAAGRRKGLAVVEALKPRLAESGIGTGAWSVAELLRAYVEDLRGGEKPAPKKAASPAAKRGGKKEA